MYKMTDFSLRQDLCDFYRCINRGEEPAHDNSARKGVHDGDFELILR